MTQHVDGKNKNTTSYTQLYRFRSDDDDTSEIGSSVISVISPDCNGLVSNISVSSYIGSVIVDGI